MDEKETVEKSVRRGLQRGSRHNRYSFDEKLRAVKLHLEEGFKAELVSVETGVSASSLALWVRAFRKESEMGLRRESSPRPGRRLPRPVLEKIIEMKRSNPWYGVKRIAEGLRRWFFLEASPETVRKTLHEADLMQERVEAATGSTVQGMIHGDGWIRVHANDSIQQLEKIDHRSLNAAWRHAAESWLRCQGLITVSINKKVLPNYPLEHFK